MEALFLRLVTLILTLTFLSAGVANATVGPDNSRLQPNAVRVAEYVKQRYPEVPEIGGWRQDPLPDHPTGHAIDIMIPYPDLGHRIIGDLLAHGHELGIRYTIWQQHLRRPNGTGYHMTSKGNLRLDHFDHIHVTVH